VLHSSYNQAADLKDVWFASHLFQVFSLSMTRERQAENMRRSWVLISVREKLGGVVVVDVVVIDIGVDVVASNDN